MRVLQGSFRRVGLVVAVAVMVLAGGAPDAGAAWRRPVPGEPARAFAYSRSEPFVAGAHRGLDLAARPGAVVRAACAGHVAAIGFDAVTVRCGRWRVTHLPLARVGVRVGARVRAGARLGTLAASGSHAGLHLGVRRADDRFGYVDPAELLPGVAGVPAAPPAVGPGPRVARPPAPPPVSPRVAVPVVRSVPTAGGVRVRPERSPAPWPVWAGLALVLCGAVGSGVRVRVRGRRSPREALASAR